MADKVTFDGTNKLITINSGESLISIKTDIYSAWKTWVATADNSKYEIALRTIGGDPLGNNRYAGDIYFLRNGWKILTDHPVIIEGVLYHDDGIPTFIVEAGGTVTSTVSSIVQTVTTDGYSTDQVQDAVGVELQPLLVEIQKTLKKVEEAQAFILSK
jgi:hypothetical protein